MHNSATAWPDIGKADPCSSTPKHADKVKKCAKTDGELKAMQENELETVWDESLGA